MSQIKKYLIATAMTSSMLCGQAYAQATDATPSSVVESYKSWRVECNTINAPAPAEDPAKKTDAKAKDAKPAASSPTTLCDAYQVYNNNKTGNEVARFIVSYVGEKGKDRKLIAGIRTLVDNSFEANPKLVADGADLIEGKFVRCAGNACFVRFDISETDLETLAKAKQASFRYPLASGRVIQINMSGDGLDGALKSLKDKEK